MKRAPVHQRARHHRAGMLAVLGMHALEVGLEARLEALARRRRRCGRARPTRPRARSRGSHSQEPEAGHLLRLGEQRALLAQRLLGEPAVGDVARHHADPADHAAGVEHRELRAPGRRARRRRGASAPRTAPARRAPRRRRRRARARAPGGAGNSSASLRPITCSRRRPWRSRKRCVDEAVAPVAALQAHDEGLCAVNACRLALALAQLAPRRRAARSGRA